MHIFINMGGYKGIKVEREKTILEHLQRGGSSLKQIYPIIPYQGNKEYVKYSLAQHTLSDLTKRGHVKKLGGLISITKQGKEFLQNLK